MMCFCLVSKETQAVGPKKLENGFIMKIKAMKLVNIDKIIMDIYCVEVNKSKIYSLKSLMGLSLTSPNAQATTCSMKEVW